MVWTHPPYDDISFSSAKLLNFLLSSYWCVNLYMLA